MSGKCTVVGSCVLFLTIITFSLLNEYDPFLFWGRLSYRNPGDGTLTIPYGTDNQAICGLHDTSISPGLKSPSLSSFIQATTAGNKGSRLNGLAVYLQLTDACEALEDVSKAKIQLHKIALVTLTNNNQTRCPYQKLAVNVQNAGYTVLIIHVHSADSQIDFPSSMQKDKLLIPVLQVEDNECTNRYENTFTSYDHFVWNASAPITVEIRVPEKPSYAPDNFQSYLENLVYWSLVGPIITLEWLRRKKKFCWMSGGQHLDNNGQTAENEAEVQTMEEGGNRTEGSHLHLTIENYQERDDEGQPLLTALPTVINDYTRQPRGTAYVNIIRKASLKITAGFLYLILVIAALPVGISVGGLSFFRFDNPMGRPGIATMWTLPRYLFIDWPTFQIFCFLLYSRFACKVTWTIQNDFSKLIRSDWFASNIYLLVLGVVVPYCSLTNLTDDPKQSWATEFSFYVTYNIMCTVCNMLFIFILNKHKFVTRYVFYMSICMICAYIESDIVAVFYFAQNSQGSLGDIKLTALRTVAIGLTLTVSLNSSMHIFRKLVKPPESLFSGLSEK